MSSSPLCLEQAAQNGSIPQPTNHRETLMLRVNLKRELLIFWVLGGCWLGVRDVSSDRSAGRRASTPQAKLR